MTEQVSLWEPPPGEQPAQQPPPLRQPPPVRRPTLPQPPRLPWYRQSWFIALVVVVVSAAAGALAGAHLP